LIIYKKCDILILIKNPGVYDHLDILNLHLRLWDTYIFSWMSGLHYAGEGRKLCAVTHLA